MYYPPRIANDPPPGFGLRQRTWRREALLLHKISSGQSIAVMVREEVARLENIAPDSGSLKGTMRELVHEGWLWSEVHRMYLGGGGRARCSLEVVGLTARGQALARHVGWALEETEYERLCRLHEGRRFPEHTLCILIFVRQAALRGFDAYVCPETRDTRFQPDVCLYDVRDEDWDIFPHCYVEVERTGDCAPKWAHLSAINDNQRVFVVAPNPAKRESLVREIAGQGYEGCATDLRTLLYRQGSELWLEEFWPE